MAELLGDGISSMSIPSAHSRPELPELLDDLLLHTSGAARSGARDWDVQAGSNASAPPGTWKSANDNSTPMSVVMDRKDRVILASAILLESACCKDHELDNCAALFATPL